MAEIQLASGIKNNEEGSASASAVRTITIDHSGFYSEFLADFFLAELEKAIPGVIVQKHNLEDQKILQIREGGRIFLRVGHLTDISDSRMAKIVDNVVSYKYLLDAAPAAEASGGDANGRTITVDHCGFFSGSQADKFIKHLKKKAIPGINVVKNYMVDEKIFQIREGGRKFLRVDHLTEISNSQMAKIVDNVVACKYLPDEAAEGSGGRTITIDHSGYLSGTQADRFVQRLKKAIPGVHVVKNFKKNGKIFQISEGGRKFLRVDGPHARVTDMSDDQEAEVVAKVVASQYLPD